MKRTTVVLSILLIATMLLVQACAPKSSNEPTETEPIATSTPELPPADTVEETQEPETAPVETEEVEATEEAELEMPVMVQRKEEVELSDYAEFVADSSEHQMELVFSAKQSVEDFNFLALTFNESAEADKVSFHTEELYHMDRLDPDYPLVVQLTFLGTIPNYGISFKDASGQTRYFSVSESGKDGSLLLTEFEK